MTLALPAVWLGSPPFVDARHDFIFVRPAVDREAEGGLGDEGVAGDGFKRGAGRVGGDFIIAGRDPNLAAMLDADLGGANDVTGGMK